MMPENAYSICKAMHCVLDRAEYCNYRELLLLLVGDHVHFGRTELTKEGACKHIAGGLVGWM